MKRLNSKYIIVWVLLLIAIQLKANHQPEFSTAGFYQVDNSGRTVYSMNPAWRMHIGNVSGAEQVSFDDKDWQVVSLPDGIELLPLEASGCINYQGEVWYRKHFNPDTKLKGKKLFLHFEAIMGKSKVYINGSLVKEQFGGYLPVIIDISEYIKWNEDNVIAVWADNSDDKDYPPGKFQDVLDFAYFGGIYRDCWLIAHNEVYITDPNFENEIAGGGLFVSYNNVSKSSADINLRLHIRNNTSQKFNGSVEYDLQSIEGKSVSKKKQKVSLSSATANHFLNKITLRNPDLWSPDKPHLYNLYVTIKDSKGKIVDGYRQKIGIRSIEFKGVDGFWLNGEPYPRPVIGANRHQDYAIVGNAVSNSAHWRDAKKLRDAGLEVIRNAHYPQDPAFMDACDELGLLLIENTPGWQYWNPAPTFEQRVYNDIRQIVRRDRNRPCVWLWEPILNETHYPGDFAQNTINVVNEEYPYPYCYTASDERAGGSEHFPIIFGHPSTGDKSWALQNIDSTKTYFTREWGDNVDDWTAQNSSSRIARNWGEAAMHVQAHLYAMPNNGKTSYDSFYKTTRHHIGGALWHSFDHQRGYHPDPFYGGIMDVFRQPKYSYYMFMSQRNPKSTHAIADSGPMVYIAHEMTPASGKDVIIFSNCDEVRFNYNDGEYEYTYKTTHNSNQMPYPPIVIKDVYDFMHTRYRNKSDGTRLQPSMVAEGYIDGKLVASHTVTPAMRPTKVKLTLDNEGMNFYADGSDVVTLVASITDNNGNVKRLTNQSIRFEIEGEGHIVGNADIFANPAPLRWGTAPVLIKSTTKAGKIKVRASLMLEGSRTPTSAEIEIETLPPVIPTIYLPSEIDGNGEKVQNLKAKKTIKQSDSDERLREVEKQQQEFGENTSKD
ncbi:beta-galactosidase [Dysgonomonadaceae bacterium PH5-43]|nr:beta-galactosidase [Dysgonomonadaceae bacterium PH5-43]